ncbi:hypothetical protein ABLN64_17265 [Mycobacterium tuberculosis]
MRRFTLERMLVDVAAVHRAFQHAIPDTRHCQLHDDIRCRQQHCRRVQQVGNPGSWPLHRG